MRRLSSLHTGWTVPAKPAATPPALTAQQVVEERRRSPDNNEHSNRLRLLLLTAIWILAQAQLSTLYPHLSLLMFY